jgi:chemotaxis protein MotA
MSVTSIAGLIIAFGSLITGFLLENGHISSLFLLSPFIIVFGGTVGAVIVSYGFQDTAQAVKSLFSSYLKVNQPDPEKLIQKICSMANLCRSQGLLQLQNLLNDSELQTENLLMLKEGMILATDMKDKEGIQDVLEADLNSYSIKKQMEIDVFEGAGGFSPTLGVIGTVMGLVQVLSNMTDSEHLTMEIGVAFIATLYGVVFANIIYFPCANHLKVCLKRQKVFREMIIDGMCMLASGMSARNIENKLSLYYHAFPKSEAKYKAGIEN